MKRIMHGMLFCGIFLTMTSFILNTFIVEDFSNMNGMNGMNKVTLRASRSNDKDDFTLWDIKELTRELRSEEIAYTAWADTKAVYSNRVSEVRIQGVNSRYKDFTDINMEYGTFLSLKEEPEKGHAVVISKDLAWELYGKKNAVGMEMTLYNKPFTVVGVYDKQGRPDKVGNYGGNVIERMTDNGLEDVYIPVNTLLELDSSKKIRHIQIKVSENTLTGEGGAYIKSALSSIGKTPENYEILDFQKEGALLWQKSRLVLFIIGFITILMIVGFMKSECKTILKSYREALDRNYFVDAGKVLFPKAVIPLIKVGAAAVLLITIWKLIKFKLYISPEFIADDLTDLRYYQELFTAKIQEFNLHTGGIPDKVEVQLHEVRKITQRLMYLGIVVGIPSLYIGVRLLLHSMHKARMEPSGNSN